jgi:hypothetical protein
MWTIFVCPVFLPEANFSELRQRELRRISLPRTSVNKGMEKGRSYAPPALGLIYALLCALP